MIPTFNHPFYLISYLIWVSMAPVRRSDRARKPRDYWDPPFSLPRRRAQPAFTIFTESSNPSTQHPEHLIKDSIESLIEGLDIELFDYDLSIEFSDEDPNWDYDKDSNWGPDEGLDEGPNEDPNEDPNWGPDERPNKRPNEDPNIDLSNQLYNNCLNEYLSTQPPENPSYQPQFPPKNRVGKSRNLPENSSPL